MPSRQVLVRAEGTSRRGRRGNPPSGLSPRRLIRETRQMLAVRTKPAAVHVPGREAARADECPELGRGENGRRHNDEWLATLAHELRSPLAAILSAMEVIAGGHELDPVARQTMQLVQRQARQAMQLADDLFDLCAGSQGTLPLRTEVVDLAELVAGAAETTCHLIAARRHRLTVSLPSGPVALNADPLRLGQVLTNLLSNAAKFTDPG